MSVGSRRRLPALRPSPALTVASLALLLSVASNAAAAVVISSNSQVASGSISGHHPPSGDHANLISGSVNGTDVADDSLTGADIEESTLKGVSHRLYFFASPSGDPFTTLASVGPWTIKALCASSLYQEAQLAVRGPGQAQVGLTSSESDQSFSHTAGSYGLSAGEDTVVANAIVPSSGVFERLWGTVMLRSSSTVAVLEVQLISDWRNGSTDCLLYGTATLGI